MGASCVIYKHPTIASLQNTEGEWSTDHCKIVSQTNEFVECKCDHMSEYAVLAQSDDRTGFEIYFFVACFAVIVSIYLFSVHHLVYYDDKYYIITNLVFKDQ